VGRAAGEERVGVVALVEQAQAAVETICRLLAHIGRGRRNSRQQETNTAKTAKTTQ
jgi:hypothetical protein